MSCALLAACAGVPAQQVGADAGPAAPAPVVAPVSPVAAAPIAPQGWSESYGAGVGQVGVHFAGNAPLESSAPLLNSGVSFAGLDQRLQYSAGYQISPGDLLNPAAVNNWRANALPQSVGSQTVNQQVKVQSDPVYGAPLTVGARYQQQASLLVNGESETAQQAMDLGWAPDFAAFQLNWTPEGAPVDAMQALQCDISGQVRVPLTMLSSGTAGGRFIALDAGTRACKVVGDDAALGLLSANTWSTAVRWGKPSRETALRLQSVTPGPGAGVVESERPMTVGSGYELKVSQKRSLGDWQANAGVAYRRPPEAERAANPLAGDYAGGIGGGPASSPWAANAELTRRLAMLSVAATWRRGDPYWFLPEVRQAADTFGVAVDLSPWAATLWNSYTPTLAMSYNWTRAEAGSTRDDEQSINWNIAFPWR
ncbi:MAG: hypothetical protein ACREVL_14515 [Solimonas sp.]